MTFTQILLICCCRWSACLCWFVCSSLHRYSECLFSAWFVVGFFHRLFFKLNDLHVSFNLETFLMTTTATTATAAAQQLQCVNAKLLVLFIRRRTRISWRNTHSLPNELANTVKILSCPPDWWWWCKIQINSIDPFTISIFVYTTHTRLFIHSFIDSKSATMYVRDAGEKNEIMTIFPNMPWLDIP